MQVQSKTLVGVAPFDPVIKVLSSLLNEKGLKSWLISGSHQVSLLSHQFSQVFYSEWWWLVLHRISFGWSFFCLLYFFFLLISPFSFQNLTNTSLFLPTWTGDFDPFAITLPAVSAVLTLFKSTLVVCIVTICVCVSCILWDFTQRWQKWVI